MAFNARRKKLRELVVNCAWMRFYMRKVHTHDTHSMAQECRLSAKPAHEEKKMLWGCEFFAREVVCAREVIA